MTTLVSQHHQHLHGTVCPRLWSLEQAGCTLWEGLGFLEAEFDALAHFEVLRS